MNRLTGLILFILFAAQVAVGAPYVKGNDFLWQTDGTGNIGASGATRPNNLYIKNAGDIGGALNFSNSSGANITWTSNNAGNIGSSAGGANPTGIYAAQQLSVVPSSGSTIFGFRPSTDNITGAPGGNQTYNAIQINNVPKFRVGSSAVILTSTNPLLWEDDGSATIGGATGNRPSIVYAKNRFGVLSGDDAGAAFTIGTDLSLTGVSQKGVYSGITSTNAATGSTVAFWSAPTTKAQAYTTGARVGHYHQDIAKGAGSTITRDAAFNGDVPTQGTNNAFLSDNLAWTGNYFINSTSTNPSQLAGVLHMNGASGKNIIWDTDGGGSIGASAATRPASIFSKTSITNGTSSGILNVNGFVFSGSGTARWAFLGSDSSSNNLAGFGMQTATGYVAFVQKDADTLGTIYLSDNGPNDFFKFDARTAGGSFTLMNSTGAHILWNTDNASDIGASGANRPRDVNIGRNAIVAGVSRVGGSGTITVSNEQSNVKQTTTSGTATQSSSAFVAQEDDNNGNTAITNAHRTSTNVSTRTITLDTTDTGQLQNIYGRGEFVVTAGKTLTNTNATMGYATFTAAAPTLPTGALAFTNFAGVSVDASPLNTGTNKYGIYVGSQSGATNNYAIYTNGGPVVVNDTGGPNPQINLQLSGTTKAIFGIAAANGNINPGSLTGDLTIRTPTQAILFSTDGGSTTSFKLSTAGAVNIVGSSNLTKLDIVNGAASIPNGSGTVRMTDVTTNTTAKDSAFTTYPYNTAQKDAIVFESFNDSTNNTLNFGGGYSGGQAATKLNFFTATAQNTNTGTRQMFIGANPEGLVGIGNNNTNPQATLDVTSTGTAGNLGSPIGRFITTATSASNSNPGLLVDTQTITSNVSTSYTFQASNQNTVNAFVVQNNGGVGIGTATANINGNSGRYLTIQGPTTFPAFVELSPSTANTGSASTTGGIKFNNGNNNTAFILIENAVGGASNSGTMRLKTANAGSLTDGVVINSDQTVLVGATAALNLTNERLSVKNSISSNATSAAAISYQMESTFNGASTLAMVGEEAQLKRSITTSQTDSATHSAISVDTTFSVPTGQTLTTGGLNYSGIKVNSMGLSGGGSLAFSEYAGIFIQANSVASGTNKYGLFVDTQSGASTNWAIFANGNVRLQGGGESLEVRDTNGNFGTNSAPTIYFKDSANSTGMILGYTNAAQNNFRISTSNSAGMYFNSSASLGDLGGVTPTGEWVWGQTSAGNAKSTINSPSSSTTAAGNFVLALRNSDGTVNSVSTLAFENGVASPTSGISGVHETSSNPGTGSLNFWTTNSGTNSYGITLDKNNITSFGGAMAVKHGTDVTSAATNDTFPSSFGYYKIVGSTAMAIRGIVAGIDGQILRIYSNSGQNTTFNNQDSNATAANRIITMTGGNVATTADGFAELIYDSSASRWILMYVTP